MMGKKALIPSEVVLSKLNENPEFRKEKRKLSPYFSLMTEIINRRNELGITQKELAERAWTHQSRISKIESAELDVRLSTLINIAEALETELQIKFEPRLDYDFGFNETVFNQLLSLNTITTIEPCRAVEFSV